jgi:MFS family permease
MSAQVLAPLSRRNFALVWTLAVATIALAAMRFNALPMFVSALVTNFDVHNDRVGVLAAALYATSTVTGVITSLLLRRLNRRLLLILSLLLAGAGTTASWVAGDFQAFFFAQVVASAGAGVMAVTCYSLLGDLGHEDAVFGSLYAVMVLSAGLALYVLPSFLTTYGLDGILIFAAGASFALAVLAVSTPATKGKLAAPTVSANAITGRAAAGLAGIFLWSVSQSVYWVYAERIGHNLQIGSALIGSILAVATVGSGIAPVVGPIVGRHFGHRRPLVVCTVIMCTCLLALATRTTAAWFGTAVIAHALAWGLYEPYLNSLTASADFNGRAVPWIQPVGGIGLALGPLLGSIVVTDQSLAGALYASVLTLVASCVCAQLSVGRSDPSPLRESN